MSALISAALRAAAVIAEKMNDADRQKKWLSLLGKGQKSLEEKLWNGSYYNLWCDEKQTDQSLMTDQLDGEWFLRTAGIGGIFDDERVAAVLKLIFSKNFDREAGLINASCPEGRNTSLFTYKNCQAEAVWTGIGYAFAALAITAGLQDIADTLVESIHNNQMSFGAFWDHWECGHHYTRPMSSFSTINAAMGLSVDSEAKVITIKPVSKSIRLPLCLCNALGTVTVTDGKVSIELTEGSLDGWEIITD